MLLGIDVGGTFTDAVLIAQGQIIAQVKRKTTHEKILEGIIEALDEVLCNEDVSQIERVVISSTIVTNALTQGHIEPAFLAVMTGPGMNVSHSFPVEPYYVSGYVDHRGKVVAPIDWSKHQDLHKKLTTQVAAVSGKFSVRNPVNEETLAREIKDCSCKKVFLGSELSGELNFVRRTNSAYFSAIVTKEFEKFCQQIERSMKQRNITAPVHILKADGGTLPLAVALRQPIEAVFTGPAASILGIEALGASSLKSISLDVGGTTIDIAFWENGLPLMAKSGAVVDGYPTSVRSFHMRSIGIGGDSHVKRVGTDFSVGPERIGPAVAVGGQEATLSDALITAGYIEFGDKGAAQKAIQKFALPEENILEVAEKIINVATKQIEVTIQEMLHEWSIQPVYTVNDVIKGTDFEPELLIGVGGGAKGLIKALANKMALPFDVPRGAMVANAIGAALARPTLSASLRADTTEGYYLIPESGKREKLPSGFSLAKAEELLANWLREQTSKWQLPDQEVEVISKEFFRTIHGYYDSGEIISLSMQLKPGILQKVAGREVEL